jgi:hypothetical protein
MVKAVTSKRLEQMTLRISLLVMLVSLLGCTIEIQRAQTAQPVAEKAQEEQPKSRRCQLLPIALDRKCVAAS